MIPNMCDTLTSLTSLCHIMDITGLNITLTSWQIIDNTWLIKSPVWGLAHKPWLGSGGRGVVEGGGGGGGLGAGRVARGGWDDPGGPVEAKVGAGAWHGACGEGVVSRSSSLVSKHWDVGLKFRKIDLNCPRNSWLRLSWMRYTCDQIIDL